MAALVVAGTTFEVAVNVAAVAPAGTMIDAGTVAALVFALASVTERGTAAAALLLDSVTTEPPAGATAFNATVPVLPAAPVTDVGLSVRDFSSGITVSEAVLLDPP